MRCNRPSSGFLFACILAAAAASQVASGDAAAAELEPELELLLAAVEINGSAQGVRLLAQDQSGEFYAAADTLFGWRLPVPVEPPVAVGGTGYYSLAALDGVVVTLDRREMRIDLIVPANLFRETSVSLARQASPLGRQEAVGAYLDYDLAYTKDSLQHQHALSALLQPTLFTQRGSFTSGLLYNNQGDVFGVAENGWKRLETTWVYDDPERMRSLRLGDSVTMSSGWARSVRFGGFQIASNFATRPAEITFPQPSISGTSAVPSVLDIYVNGTMRSQYEVQGGAFEISDIPVVTGAGQVQVVARDLLGREQVFTQNFYSSEQLLRPGLNDYSLSVGRLRENFALRSGDYGATLVSGTLRRGLNERVTIAGQVMLTSEKQAAGATAAMTLGRAGLTSASVALSSASGSGSLWLVGHQYQGRRFRVDVRLQGTTARFSQPGVDFESAFPKRQSTLSGGIGLGQHGSIGMSLVKERMHDRSDRRISNLTYSRTLPARIMLSFVVSRIETQLGSTEVNINLTRSLGPRASASLSLSRRADGRRTRIDQRFNLPSGPGFGYRTSSQRGVQEIDDAEFMANTAFARYGIEFRRHDNGRSFRMQSRGTIARFGGGWFAAREISEGFAVADAGGFAGVRVYLENRAIGVTRADGLLLVPGLRPYEYNQLRLETADIPLMVRIDEPVLTVSPYFRSGVLASFGVRAATSVMLQAVDDDGRPLSEGAQARVNGGPFEHPVGLKGSLFLEDITSGDRVDVLADGRICTLDLQGVPFDSAFADIGSIICAQGTERLDSADRPNE